jgi:hypothetical protein
MMRRMKRWGFLLFVMAACSPPALQGARPVTAADKAAPVETELRCYQASGMFKADGKQAVRNHTVVPLVVAKGPEGLALIQGHSAITNHWEAPDGDHFFSWVGEIGEEVIVAPDRKSAVQHTYAEEVRVTKYRRVQNADGTTRPEGIPYMVATCVTTPDGEPVVDNVTPVSSDQVPKRTKLAKIGCSTKKGELVQELGADPYWMPLDLYRDEAGTLYATFTNAKLNSAWLLYALSLASQLEGGQQYNPSFGAVKLIVTLSKTGDFAEAFGTIAGREENELKCSYKPL